MALVHKTGRTTRYFLRRLAEARRRKNNASDFVPYSNAVTDVSLTFVGLPVGALLSCLIILSLKWMPDLARQWPLRSVRMACFIVAFVAFLAGHFYFLWRFRDFRRDPTPSLDFDSDFDREAMGRQKISMILLCVMGLIITTVATLIVL